MMGNGDNAGIFAMIYDLLICFFITDFVRKMGASPGLVIEPLIPFGVKKGLSA